MCNSRRSGRSSRRDEVRDVAALEPDRPGGRLDSRTTQLPTVDLPLPDSPTSPSISPGADRERHVVDGVHDAAAAEQLRAGVEVLDEVARPRASARGCRSFGLPGWKQATRCAGRDLAQLRHLACAIVRVGARAARRRTRRPSSGSSSDGTRPGISLQPAVWRRPAAGSRRAGRACTGAAGRAKSSCDRRLLDLAPGVHDEHAVGDVGDDAEVVRDQHDRGAEPLADVAHQVEDPGLDRHVERGRRLVRDRGSSGRRRAPSRSSRAAASRRRAGAGTRRPARSGAGMPHEVEQLDRALVARALARVAEVAAAAPRRSGGRRVNDGLSDVIGSWKTNAISRPRIRADLRRRRGEQVEAVEARLPVDRRGRRQQPHQRTSALTLLPQPDSPTMPSTSRSPSANDSSSTACTDAVVGLEADARGRRRRAAARHQRVVRGSRTSRRPSPSRLNDERAEEDREPGIDARAAAPRER